LRVERVPVLAVRRRVPRHVVVEGAVPAPARRPLRDAPARAAADLRDRGRHPRLLIEVADDARSLHLREALADEELEGDLVVAVLGRQIRLLRIGRVGAVRAGTAGEEQRECESSGEGAEGRGGVHADPWSQTRATPSTAKSSGNQGVDRAVGWWSI